MQHGAVPRVILYEAPVKVAEEPAVEVMPAEESKKRQFKLFKVPQAKEKSSLGGIL